VSCGGRARTCRICVEATGFELVVADDLTETRAPTPEEMAQLERLDPKGLRHAEVPAP